jgi:tRNA(Ile)-lysidine synthase
MLPFFSSLGPWPTDRRVAVAVSGGADSMCLALLAAHWGQPLALIVDHGLRPESSSEAAETLARLAAIGVPGRILTLSGLRPGAAKARAARYQALETACREEGLVDLLLGHHARDQAETVLMRQRSQSGPTGLAAMPAVVEGTHVRLVRPLLGVPPGALRAILRAAGVGWVEDPSNTNSAALRARLRQELDDLEGDGPRTTALLSTAAAYGAQRARQDAEIASVLAERATIRPEGFAVLSHGRLPVAALGALIRMVGGRPYPAATSSLASLAAEPRPAVLAGVRLLPAGHLGPGLLLVREPSAMAPTVPAHPAALWDGRFRLTGAPDFPEGATVGALGPDAARLRRFSDLPSAVMVTLPALRVHGVLAAVPHIGYRQLQSCARMVFSPASNAAGAPFLVSAWGMRTAPTPPMLQDADDTTMLQDAVRTAMLQDAVRTAMLQDAVRTAV